MAKYVCDYETVIEIGKQVCSTAQTINGDLDTYKGAVEKDLADWKSIAKNSFVTTNTAQVTAGKAMAEVANSVGSYIQAAAQAIQSTDEGLAGQISI